MDEMTNHDPVFALMGQLSCKLNTERKRIEDAIRDRMENAADKAAEAERLRQAIFFLTVEVELVPDSEWCPGCGRQLCCQVSHGADGTMRAVYYCGHTDCPPAA
jgi:hypothetical protein